MSSEVGQTLLAAANRRALSAAYQAHAIYMVQDAARYMRNQSVAHKLELESDELVLRVKIDTDQGGRS